MVLVRGLLAAETQCLRGEVCAGFLFDFSTCPSQPLQLLSLLSQFAFSVILSAFSSLAVSLKSSGTFRSKFSF